MGSIISLFTSALGGIWGYVAALGIGAVVAGAGVGWTVHKIDHDAYVSLQLADQKAETKAITEAAQIVRAKDQVALDHAVTEATAQQKIVTVTNTITREIHDHVTATQDQEAAAASHAGCVTYGFVRLLYAAERGLDPAGLGLPAGQSDDACTAYGLSDLAAAIASDFGIARENAEQLNALEAAVTDLNKAGQPPPAN